MFEGNSPVDRASLPCASDWDAVKKIAKWDSEGDSEGAQQAMFWGTAERLYRLQRLPFSGATPSPSRPSLNFYPGFIDPKI